MQLARLTFAALGLFVAGCIIVPGDAALRGGHPRAFGGFALST